MKIPPREVSEGMQKMAQDSSGKQLTVFFCGFCFLCSHNSFKNVEIFCISSYVYRKFRAVFRVTFIPYVWSRLSFFLVHRFVCCILGVYTVKPTLCWSLRYPVFNTVKLATKCKSKERRDILSTSMVFLTVILYYCIQVFWGHVVVSTICNWRKINHIWQDY